MKLMVAINSMYLILFLTFLFLGKPLYIILIFCCISNTIWYLLTLLERHMKNFAKEIHDKHTIKVKEDAKRIYEKKLSKPDMRKVPFLRHFLKNTPFIYMVIQVRDGRMPIFFQNPNYKK
jgi:hypothetical protein